MDGLCYGTDKYPYLSPDAETSSEQPNPIPTNRAVKTRSKLKSEPYL